LCKTYFFIPSRAKELSEVFNPPDRYVVITSTNPGGIVKQVSPEEHHAIHEELKNEGILKYLFALIPWIPYLIPADVCAPKLRINSAQPLSSIKTCYYQARLNEKW